jgi:3-deoxy-manno-octulosonate cytidylyltransferase (CMP-KDO synthetase)
MPRTIGIIPARYGSTRFPGKPLAEIFGKPMIVHTYLNSKKSVLLDDVIVATDNDKIAKVIEDIGGKVVITPSELKSGSDRVAYALRNIDCDITVNIQGDEPFINGAAIDSAVKPMIDDNSIMVSTLIKRIEDPKILNDPNIVKAVKDINDFALYFSRAPIPFMRDSESQSEQLKKEIFFKHIGLYVFRTSFLKKFVKMDESGLENCEKLEQLRILENGYRIKCIITDYESISIDTIEDLNKIQNLKIYR